MTIEVSKVEIDTKNQVITITGFNLDKVLLKMDLDYVPEEVDFRFDWSEGIGPKNYLLKVLSAKRQKDTTKTYKEILETLPGNTIFLNNNFIFNA